MQSQRSSQGTKRKASALRTWKAQFKSQRQRYNAPPTRALGGTNNNAIHSFIRRVRRGTFSQLAAGSGVQSVAYVFQLQDLPAYTEFTTLFDQYRIREVDIAFIPLSNSVPPTSTSGGELTTVLDYDDGTALATEIAAFQYESAVTTPPWSVNRRKLVPRLATAAYAGAFTSYANMPSSTWIDSTSIGVQYYGVKAVMPQATGSQVTLYDVIATYKIECRNTR